MAQVLAQFSLPDEKWAPLAVRNRQRRWRRLRPFHGHAILHSRPSRRELDQYRAGRDTMFAEVAKAIGGNVLVVE